VGWIDDVVRALPGTADDLQPLKEVLTPGNIGLALLCPALLPSDVHLALLDTAVNLSDAYLSEAETFLNDPRIRLALAAYTGGGSEAMYAKVATFRKVLDTLDREGPETRELASSIPLTVGEEGTGLYTDTTMPSSLYSIAEETLPVHTAAFTMFHWWYIKRIQTHPPTKSNASSFPRTVALVAQQHPKTALLLSRVT
jgi:hypothetical protein